MSETKSHQFKPPLYHNNDSRGDAPGKPPSTSHARASEQKGWDAYRKWLSTVGGKPSSARPAVDNSIYSWKGYHSWADRVKQSWKPEET